PHARLAGVGARRVGTTAIPRSLVPVVGARPRIRILDQIGWWHDGPARIEVYPSITGAERQKIRTGAAHNRLMVVVGQRKVARKLTKVGCVAVTHAVKAHRLAAVDLLPHLKKTMHRVPDRRVISDITRYPIWPVREVGGKAHIARIAGQASGIRRPRLGQSGECTVARR